MPQNMTQVGVASGKHDREHEGATTVVYDVWNIGTYDPDSDGSGNDFDPTQVYGFGRVNSFHVYVEGSSDYMARYDHDTKAVRLYALDGTGEVGNATSVNVDLRVEVRGMG